jgi:hypothetical protein
MIRVETYLGAIPAPMRADLRQLESLFDYPLGPTERVRVDHGADYGLFHSSLGESICVVAFDRYGPCATASAARRRIKRPGGGDFACVYGADLKVHPRARGGKAYNRAASALWRWTEEQTSFMYSIVMDGTAETPDSHSDRDGLPVLIPAARLEIFALVARSEADGDVLIAEAAEWERAFDDLTRGLAAPFGGDPAARSAAPVIRLLRRDGAACGRLEDTQLAKRLLRPDGSEIRSAHLSAFAFRGARAGAALARHALSLAHASGCERLFCSVPSAWADALASELADLKPLRIPATVYAAGEATAAANWIVSSSEI